MEKSVTTKQITNLLARIEKLVEEDFIHLNLFADGGGAVIYPIFNYKDGRSNGIKGVQEIVEFDSVKELYKICKTSDFYLIKMMKECCPDLTLTARGNALFRCDGNWDHDDEVFVLV